MVKKGTFFNGQWVKFNDNKKKNLLILKQFWNFEWYGKISEEFTFSKGELLSIQYYQWWHVT